MKDPANWQGGVPGVNDEALFNNQATKDVTLINGSELIIGKLTVASSFTKTMTIRGTLEIQLGNVSGDSTWASESRLSLSKDMALTVVKFTGNGKMVFSKGGFYSWGSEEVLVESDATVLLTGDCFNMSSPLKIGDGITHGTVEIGGLNNDLNNMGKSITVTSTGAFKMTQTGDTPTSRGGIVQVLVGETSPGTFTNQGTFIRDGWATGAFIPKLDYVVTNTGTIEVTANSNIRFTRADTNNNSVINESGGTVKLHYGVHVNSSGGRYYQKGGVFETHGQPASGSGSVFFEMKSRFESGSLYSEQE
jgi:hypothetical protein